MTVLLTGGAGYIGSHICVELLNRGYQVIIVDNFSNSCPKVVERIKKITAKDVVLYEADAANYQQLSQAFKENNIDIVIHLAGYKAIGESCKNPLEYYQNNLDATICLLMVMRKFGVNKMVFSSSATVYGKPQTIPLTENMATNCTNPYSRTKLFGEQILLDNVKANSNFSVAILRYFNPIGAHESGLIGENPNGTPNNLMPYITQVAIGKLNELGIFGNDYNTHDGTGVRDYIHIVDLAKAHVKAIEYVNMYNGAEIFNIGTGVGYSVLDIVNAFMRVNCIKIPYVFKPRRAGDVDEFYADPSKSNIILKWRAEKSLDNMCKDSWNWQKNNPNGYI